jgi:hypothetical protein
LRPELPSAHEQHPVNRAPRNVEPVDLRIIAADAGGATVDRYLRARRSAP